MQKRKLAIAVILNMLIVVSEIVFGMMSNSMALIADALHNFGDVISIIIALIAVIFSEKKASRNMSYGFIRSEMMAGFVNSLFLLFTMMFIAYESILRLFKPGEVNGLTMIIVAAVAFIANLLSAKLIGDSGHHHGHSHGPDHGRDHTEDENMNIRAAYIHLISDAGLSLGVILGGTLILFFKIPLIDPVFSLLFTLFILVECVRIIRVTFLSLMDATGKDLDAIEKKILSHKEVVSIHDIHLSKPSSKDVYFSAHIVLKDRTTLDQIEALLEKLRKDLQKFGVTHSLFQPETEKYHNEEKLCQAHCD